MEHPIDMPATAIPAFVGLAPGPDDLIVVDSDEFDGWGTDEDAIWGELHSSPLRRGLASYFENGGRSAVVARVEDAGIEGVRAGLAALERVDPVNLLILPSESAADEQAREIVAEAVAFCERRRAMLLVDPPPSWTSAAAIEHAMRDGAVAAVGTASPNAALYAPRLRRSDPAQAGAVETFSPVATVAGVIARTDAAQGVWSAPAGTDADLRGADGLEFRLGQREAEALNELGVSTLRTFPGRGPIVWGARTLAGADAAASEWKYVPVRRTALMLEEAIDRGLQWTQFEPNDGALWRDVRASIGTFLHDLFRAGAFHGNSPDRAYFVKCDRETITREDLDRGELTVVVGFAPIRPAEFIVLRIRALALPPND
ncbi:phage tail sheath family protein [Agromyces sp. NPDC057865]|uniref:phage tail sheath family protein n=1 Tax=Agromyces sp. NPDC057865 TaxID=3346267 RepID=UPI00366DC321